MASPSLVLIFALTAIAAAASATNRPKEGSATAAAANAAAPSDPSDHNDILPPSTLPPKPCQDEATAAKEKASPTPTPTPPPSTDDRSGFLIRDERVVSFVKSYIGDSNSSSSSRGRNSTGDWIICTFNGSSFEVVCDVISESGKYLLASVSIVGLLVVIALIIFTFAAVVDPEIDDNEILDYLSDPARGYVLKCIRQLIRRQQKYRISDCALASLKRIERSLAMGKQCRATTTAMDNNDGDDDEDNNDYDDDDDNEDEDDPAPTDDDSTPSPRTFGPRPVDETPLQAGGKDLRCRAFVPAADVEVEEVEEVESTDQARRAESFGDHVVPGGSGSGSGAGNGGGGGSGGKRTRRLAVGVKK